MSPFVIIGAVATAVMFTALFVVGVGMTVRCARERDWLLASIGTAVCCLIVFVSCFLLDIAVRP